MYSYLPFKISITTIIFILGLVGCTAKQNRSVDKYTSLENAVDYPTTHDTQASLYEKILIGRIAAGQNNYELALQYYLSALEITTDIELAKEALVLSEQLHNKDASLKIATLWVTKQPKALIPWKLIAYYSLTQQLTQQSHKAIEQVIALESNSNELLIFFNRLSSGNAHSNVQQLNVQQLLESLSLTYPMNLAVTLARATIYQRQEDWSKALTITTEAVKSHPDSLLAHKLHGNLLLARGEQEKAVQWYKLTLQKYPNSNDMLNSLGQLYYELDRYDEAREQFELILKNLPNDGDAKYMLGAIYYAEENFQQSRLYFEPLLRFRRHRNSVLFYLAEIAHKNEETDTAISLYRQVTKSRYYPTAHMMVSKLMHQQGKEIQALNYLKNISPELNDLNFRYMRAMVAAEMGAMDVTEADLRYILIIEPEHTDALNALGYTLADANKNLPEAMEMIEKALSKNPASPAVIDSMGWVLYRLGKLPEALDYLQKAYTLDKSSEIAAHLVEILWQLNEKTKAQAVIAAVLKDSPDNEAIKTLTNRLNINIEQSSPQQ
ncbi:MAG: tetratricopeptide (TPR) repeat protein [Enterobacterales bacterium]|jgi:tetratricopeptide (TPR) repeat protein